MRKRRLRHDDDEAGINITPMLDIVFIMLIFFIVTTSFVREFGLDVERPDSAAATELDADKIIAVRIDPAGAISVDGRAADLGRVRALIESSLAGKPQATVVVVVSRAADAGILVSVIDGARSAGAAKIALAEDVS